MRLVRTPSPSRGHKRLNTIQRCPSDATIINTYIAVAEALRDTWIDCAETIQTSTPRASYQQAVLSAYNRQ